MSSPSTLQLAILALQPFRACVTHGQRPRPPIEDELPCPADEFAHFLAQNGLAPLWFDHVHSQGHESHYSAAFLEILRTATIMASVDHAMQLAAARDAMTCLQEAGIPALLIKGLAIRLALYPQQQQRPAQDIDLLVPPQFSEQAVCLLTRHGMTPHPDLASIDHEIAFVYHGASVDLHWDVFRAGRSAPSLLEAFFSDAVMLNNFTVLSPTHTLLMMLTHPVITNYPLAELSLIRIIDIDRWLKQERVDWENILELTARYHTRTAAWLSLVLAKRLVDTPVPDEILRQLQPGRIRARYLMRWIDSDMALRLRGFPRLRQLGYSLPLNDSLRDAAADTRNYLNSRRRTQQMLSRYENAIQRVRQDSTDCIQ